MRYVRYGGLLVPGSFWEFVRCRSSWQMACGKRVFFRLGREGRGGEGRGGAFLMCREVVTAERGAAVARCSTLGVIVDGWGCDPLCYTTHA